MSVFKVGQGAGGGEEGIMSTQLASFTYSAERCVVIRPLGPAPHTR